MLQLTIIMIVTFIFTGIIVGIVPYITRRETVFGILIPEGRAEDPFILGLKKNYLTICLILCVLMSAPLFFFYGGGEEMMHGMAIYISVAILAYVVIAYGIYFVYHKKVKEFKRSLSPEERALENQKIVISTSFTKENKVVSMGLFAGVNLIIILVTIILPIAFYHQIPYQVPTHWGADGVVTTYTERSIGLFLSMPIFQLLLLAIMLVTNHSLRAAKQKLNVKKPKISREQNIAFRYAMSKLMFVIAVSMSALLLMIQWMMVFGIQSGNLIMIASGIMLVPALGGSLYIAVRYGQGGERLKVREEDGILESGLNVDDDRHWKVGLFYINPQDPSVWVETRFGIGMTINYGNPKGIAILVGILLATVVMVAVPFLLGM